MPLTDMEILTILGLLCVCYTTAEVLRLARRPVAHASGQGSFEFGAVDLESGRPIDVRFDRRVRNAPRGSQRRRATDRS